MAVIFQVEIVWVVMPCSVVVGYHCFRGPCCLHLQDFTLKMEAVWTSEILVSLLHDTATQKTST
jgi:hypothetical protein